MSFNDIEDEGKNGKKFWQVVTSEDIFLDRCYIRGGKRRTVSWICHCTIEIPYNIGMNEGSAGFFC